MEIRDSGLEDLYQELGERFGALSQLFGGLTSPAAVKELLDSLSLPDPKVPFGRFVEKFALPIRNGQRCMWLYDVIEKIVSTGVYVPEYRLRLNLTPAEQATLFQLTWQFRTPQAGGRFPWTLPDTSGAIKPGPFLDALIAAGLVNFKLVEQFETALFFKKREWACS